ncbi:hypothetical protein EYR38_008806 [Pleurotus pulmonarius]|nr:hypothetical protein EYR38_008806 [Pleurotus pulmonarius]
MASSAVVDPLQTLQAALTVQANSKEQADILDSLREYLEAQPALIPVLAGTLVGQVVNGGDSLLKSWVFNLLHFAICRSALSQDVRTTLSSQSLDSLAQLLYDPNPALVKVAIQTLTTVYPLLFRLLCTTRSNPAAWETLTRCKLRILEFIWSPGATAGIRLSAMKFMQRVILVQTRGVSDPRLQNKNDPNISFCPADHPFLSVPTLEQEGQRLYEGIVTIFLSSQNVDLLTAVLNSWLNFVKLRPLHAPKVIATIKQWSPDTLKGQSASSVKSVEKAIRIFLIHISRIPAYAQYGAIIGEVLTIQGARMDAAAAEEKRRKAAAAESRKRATSASAERPPEAKRAKLEPEEAPVAATTTSSTTPSPLASFDFTTLPASLITDLIVANLDAFTEVALVNLIQQYRTSNNIGAESKVAGPSKSTPPPAPPTTVKPSVPLSSPLSAPAIDLQNEQTAASTPPPVVVKEEPIDPMQMDIDQDEIEYEPEQLNLELSGDVPQAAVATADVSPESLDLQLVEFKLPPPKDLDEEERITQLRVGVSRIWNGAEEARQGADVTHADPAQDMWMLLIIRMITRAAEQPDYGTQLDDIEGKTEEDTALATLESRHDRLRQILCDYIMADFPSRIRLATTWMNEEWYNDRIRTAKDHSWRPNYDIWLHQIVVSYQTLLDGKDRTFGRFLLDLPMIPSDVLNLLRDQCLDNESPERMQVGFTTLRGFVIQRPSLRGEALNALLELTTHPEKKIRGAAINTVKIWVPNSQPMDTMIREFALQMLRRLQLQPPKPAETTKPVDGDEKMEDGQLPLEDLIQTPFLPEKVELPAEKSQILQHVELLFALSVKVPDFLDEIFAAYGSMDVTVQKAIQELITALIRSLGAESLALRVLTIFTEHGRPSAQLVALVKGLISERDLDARFLIPIIAEMDKADIMRYLPRIVSILNGEAEPKNLVRSVFSSVVTTPPQTFGSVTSNLPRVRQSELLTPAELMVLLHDSEKEIGLKSAIEAIGICFSMTDVFRSEILAVVMQQIMDEPILPVLFLRTVIQAVKTYKSLIGFVSTTLLSRLITKKIWTNPPLWEGFIRCAKVIAPASFSALLQLPKDQLRELVDKQPSLKSGLRDYVIKKAPNKARGAGYLDIFGDGEDNDSSTPLPSTPVPQPDPSLAAPAA